MSTTGYVIVGGVALVIAGLVGLSFYKPIVGIPLLLVAGGGLIWFIYKLITGLET